MPFQDRRNPCKAASCAYGAFTCSSTCQLEGRIFAWSPNEQERGKNVHSHPIPLLMGTGSGTRVLHIAAQPLLVHGWYWLWEFCCSVLHKNWQTPAQRPSAFFFFFSLYEAASQGAWAMCWGFPGSMEREAQLWESYFIYFSPVLLLSQASYLWSQGRKWKGWKVRGAWGVLRTCLPKACSDSPGLDTKAGDCIYFLAFLAWFINSQAKKLMCSPSKRGI